MRSRSSTKRSLRLLESIVSSAAQLPSCPCTLGNLMARPISYRQDCISLHLGPGSINTACIHGQRRSQCGSGSSQSQLTRQRSRVPSPRKLMAPAADYCHDFHGSEVPHVPIFPLMAKGHTVPLLDLACLLRHRGLAAVTFLTTPGNASFVRASLAGDDAASVVELPFPAGHAPAGGESAEGVTSTSSFAAFAEATSPLRPRLEQVLAAMRPPVDLLVADGFLYWAHASAAALGVPTVSFLGTSAFAHAVREACVRDKLGASAQRDDDADASTGMYTVPEFPHLQFSLADLVPPPLPLMELDAKMAAGVAAGHGLIMNTFRDLVDRYVEHWNRHIGPRAWPIGPLCLARQSSSSSRWVSRSVSKVGERW
ncbi:UDP-glycosyltransferase 90A1 [Setaria viridis]|uniref:UDP-glycosyltransferase 90A1 n=1 Tax=Setaria viridis TaxID=4556 RepID=UPI003B3A577D